MLSTKVRASRNCSGRALWVRSPERTTRSGRCRSMCCSTPWDTRGRCGGPKWTSEMWKIVRTQRESKFYPVFSTRCPGREPGSRCARSGLPDSWTRRRRRPVRGRSPKGSRRRPPEPRPTGGSFAPSASIRAPRAGPRPGSRRSSKGETRRRPRSLPYRPPLSALIPGPFLLPSPACGRGAGGEGPLDLVLAAAPADQQADQEPHTGGDEHRPARIVAHIVGDVAGELAGPLAHLAVALAGAIGHLAIALAGPLRTAADLVRRPLRTAPDVFGHLLVPALDVLAQLLEAIPRRDDALSVLTRRFGTFRRPFFDCIGHGCLPSSFLRLCC